MFPCVSVNLAIVRTGSLYNRGMAYESERLDRIERILEETAIMARENERKIAAVTTAQDACFSALRDLIQTQEILMKTVDRIAQLWDRSPN